MSYNIDAGLAVCTAVKREKKKKKKNLLTCPGIGLVLCISRYWKPSYQNQYLVTKKSYRNIFTCNWDGETSVSTCSLSCWFLNTPLCSGQCLPTPSWVIWGYLRQLRPHGCLFVSPWLSCGLLWLWAALSLFCLVIVVSASMNEWSYVVNCGHTMCKWSGTNKPKLLLFYFLLG